MNEARDNTHIPPFLNFKKGDRLLCTGSRTVDGLLTDGKIYEALEDAEPGIFSDRPYITVTNDLGRPWTCHAHRFELEKTA